MSAQVVVSSAAKGSERPWKPQESAGDVAAMGSNQEKQARTTFLGKQASPANQQRILENTGSSSRSLAIKSPLDKPFAALASLLGDFTLILDSGGTVHNAYVNAHSALRPNYSTLTGQRISDLIGKKNSRILEEALRDALKSGIKTHRKHSAEQSHHGRVFESLLIPLDHCDPGSKRIALLLRDMTARLRSEEQSRTNEALLLQAEELARIGSFELDLRTGAGKWSKQLYRNLQIDPSQPVTGEMFLKMVHPDDYARLIREMDEGVARKQNY
jgi:hypothetical protein